MNASGRPGSGSTGALGPPILSAARSTALRSSRTLPTHGCADRRASSIGESCSGMCAPSRSRRFVEEGLDEHRDVVEPLAQRRHAQAHHREAEEEIGAEAPFVDLARQVAVGGGDDAHVDGARRRGAERRDLAALDDAEQLGLQRQRQLADLVEEDGAAVGHLQQALALGVGAGEGALGVAEELRLHELAEERAAVDDDEGAVLARRLVVDALGDLLLAGAGLAFDEHRAVALGDGVELLEQLAHRDRAAEHRAEAGARRRRHLGLDGGRRHAQRGGADGERDRLDDGDLADLARRP